MYFNFYWLLKTFTPVLCFHFSNWKYYSIIFFKKNILYSIWLGEHLRTWRRVTSLLFHRPLVLWRGCPELSGFTLRWDNPLLSLFFQMSDLEYSAIYCFTCEMSWLHVSIGSVHVEEYRPNQIIIDWNELIYRSKT